mmetsp:Transcript_103486/g.183835  ORF Transcript_103486/g.183835 Transcript_103486/m.183835 type:complete len:187 (+) Transcript_103486:36-596(+)
MGCGAISQRKYEEVTVNSMHGLEDDTQKQRRIPQSAEAGSDRENQPPQQKTNVGGNSQDADKPTKYRPGALDGLEVVEGGDSELAKAVAAANDENLLQKYAQLSEGKKRPGATKRVFAPSNGPLSGEPLRISKRGTADQFETGEYVLANNRVGNLRLHHRNDSSPSPPNGGIGLATAANVPVAAVH